MISTALSSIAAVVAVAALAYLIVVAAAAVAGAMARGGRRERAVDAYEALAVSRFTIPVSIIVPVDGPCAALSPSVAALLSSNYPELEVIVVADSLSFAALEGLKRDWSLEPKELFFRRTLESAPVRRIFTSERDARLVVVEKDPAGRADAFNCGVSLARFRYVVSAPHDVMCDPDALLRLMAPALRDPGAVLAVTSYVERNAQGSPAPTNSAAGDYQRLASIRSWMASRLGWQQMECGLPPRDGVSAWRRDAVLELGGLSVNAPDAELDLLIRLQTSHAANATGRIVRTSEVFGHAPALTIPAASRVAGRRRRAVFYAFQTYRALPGGTPARVMMLSVLGLELLTPAAQGIAAAVILASTAAGWVSWYAPLLLLLMLAFGYGLMSASALLLRGGSPGAPSGSDLTRLLWRAPLELAVYRPALIWARFMSVAAPRKQAMERS